MLNGNTKSLQCNGCIQFGNQRRGNQLLDRNNIQLRETSLAIFEFLLKKFPPVAYAFNNGLSTSSAADAILNSH